MVQKNPRILIVSPEVTYLPGGMGNMANFFTAKAGGLADVTAALISALFKEGADVHVALPNYRSLFSLNLEPVHKKGLGTIRHSMPDDRIHLAEDRAFFYQNRVYSNYSPENIRISLSFQREVINNIIPTVRPDLIHANDWMTGLIPAAARSLGIRSLFTIHNIHTIETPLSHIEDRGIDAALFWHSLFYSRPPNDYWESHETNPVDFLLSGVFAAHFVNTVSPTFLHEIIQGRHDFVEFPLRQELKNKWFAGCATGILNAPDPSFDPGKDGVLAMQYGPRDHGAGKIRNKRFLQEHLGLIRDDAAPLFFWPSRLDPVQKGCQLLAEILYRVLSTWWDQNLEIVFVANGDYQSHFRDIVAHHGFHDRVAILDFDERMERLCYAASDFILMPSRFEPCGLPQMIGTTYGSLPIVYDTGGLHDTISHLDIGNNTGNGFIFRFHDSQGLFWAISEAMSFYAAPLSDRHRIIQRIMEEARARFNHANCARQYIDLYEKMLERPLIIPDQPKVSKRPPRGKKTGGSQ